MPTSKHCQACGAESSASAKFCQSCGTELAEAAAQSTSIQASARCPSCDAEPSPGAKFCRSCGADLSTEAVPVAVAQAAPSCPSCGVETRLGAKFCRSCGADLSAEAVPVAAAQAAPPAVAEAAPSCPSCGVETRAGTKFCRSCGASQTGAKGAAATERMMPAGRPARVAAGGSRRRILWVAGAIGGALVVLLIIVAALDNGGGDDGDVVVGGGGQDTGAGGGEESLARITNIRVDPSPGEGLISVIEFETGPTNPLIFITFFGPKGSGGTTGESARIKLEGIDGVVRLAFDDRGLPVEMHMPDGTAFRMEFKQDTALVHFLTADGRFGVEEVLLSQEMKDARDGIVKQVAARGGSDSPADEATRMIRSVGGRRSAGQEMVSLAASRPLRDAHEPARLEETKEVSSSRRLVVEALALEEDGEDLGPVLRLAGVDCGAFPCTVVRQEYGPTSAGWVLRADIDIIGKVEVPYSKLSVLQAECDQLHRSDGRRASAVGLGLGVVGLLLGGPIGAYIGVEVGVVASVSFSLLGYYLGISSVLTQPTCLEVASAAAVHARLGEESLVASVTFASPMAELEANVARTPAFQPFSSAEPHSYNFVFRGRRKSDAELCAKMVTTTGPDGSQVTRPFFGPERFAATCGGERPPVVEDDGVIKARGTLDPGQEAEGFLGFEADEIALSFPAGGGDVDGEFNVAMRIDTGIPILDADFRQTGTCIAVMTLSGPLDGTYDGRRELGGTTTFTLSWRYVSEQCRTLPPPMSVELPWSAIFDGQQVTVRIMDPEGGPPTTFTALVPN